jgi:hypothetical protein
MSESSTISRADLLDLIQRIETNQVKGELFFLLKKDDGLEIRKGDLDAGTQVKLTENFYGHTVNYLKNDELKVMGLTEADDRKDVLYQYDYKQPIQEFELINSVQTATSIQEYDLKEDKLSEIKGFIFAYVHKNIRVTLYKENYEVMMVKKNAGDKPSEKINILLTGSNQLKEFDESIFRLNYDFDFMMVNGELFVKDLKKLESKFGFVEVVKKKALDSIHEIGVLDLVQDITKLEQGISDVSFARKVVKVASKSVVLRKCNKKDIIKFIDTYDETLKKKFKFDESGQYINLDTKVSRTVFLQLLDDSFLYSQLTSNKYVSGSKDDINKI